MEGIPSNELAELHFYGAGCSTPAMVSKVKEALSLALPSCQIHVHHDLLAAARGLCQNEEGIVGILGTGSSSCHYDGSEIVSSIPPLGWIVGDEGAGTFLGKELLKARYYGEMPNSLSDAFDRFHGLDRWEIMDKIYTGQLPNKFLASLSRFCSENFESEFVQEIVNHSINEFVTRIIAKYDRPNLPVHFTGSISYVFRDALASSLIENGLVLGRIMQSPMEGLLKYHGVHAIR